MYEIRNTIHQHMKTCADNVRVTIYVDEVLDEPLEFCIGLGENELIITVKHDGTVEYNWTYYTYESAFWGFLEWVKDVFRKVFQSVADNLPAIFTRALLKAIK